MRNTMKLLLMAASIVITIALVVIMLGLYGRASETATEQQTNLASVQSEYENSDVLLLNGEVVDAAKAISVARKYKNNLDLYKNDVVIASGTVLGRDLFKDNSQWQIEVRITENGAAYAINFKDTSLAGSDPQNLNEAKSNVAAAIGSNVNESWSDLMSKLKDMYRNDDYRVKLATLIGADTRATWDDVYAGVDKALETYQGTTVNASEEFTIPANSTASWKMDNPTFCYLEGFNSYGVIVFTASSVKILGDFDQDFVHVDVANKTITTDNVQWTTKCTMIRE